MYGNSESEFPCHHALTALLGKIRMKPLISRHGIRVLAETGLHMRAFVVA